VRVLHVDPWGVNSLAYYANSLCAALADRTESIFVTMSGVIFTAATFQKPVVSTDVGAFSEYIIDGRTGILCENDDDAFMKTWMDVSGQVGKDELERMGKDLRAHIRATCDWRVIADKLIDEVYS
jgi:glycosyltransferase involved in cell wall biosynthesis